jgi:hypothetical protein
VYAVSPQAAARLFYIKPAQGQRCEALLSRDVRFVILLEQNRLDQKHYDAPLLELLDAMTRDDVFEPYLTSCNGDSPENREKYDFYVKHNPPPFAEIDARVQYAYFCEHGVVDPCAARVVIGRIMYEFYAPFRTFMSTYPGDPLWPELHQYLLRHGFSQANQLSFIQSLAAAR